MFGICCTAILMKLQQTEIGISYVEYGERKAKVKSKQLYKNYCSFYLVQLLYYMETSWF